MHHPTDSITHTTAFVTPVVEHWLEREIAQWVHPMKDRSDDPSYHERTLYLWATSRSLLQMKLKPKPWLYKNKTVRIYLMMHATHFYQPQRLDNMDRSKTDCTRHLYHCFKTWFIYHVGSYFYFICHTKQPLFETTIFTRNGHIIKMAKTI